MFKDIVIGLLGSSTTDFDATQNQRLEDEEEHKSRKAAEAARKAAEAALKAVEAADAARKAAGVAEAASYLVLRRKDVTIDEDTEFNVRVMTRKEVEVKRNKQRPCICIGPNANGVATVALNPNLNIIDTNAFSQRLVGGVLELPEGLVKIGDRAFLGCNGIMDVLKLPEGLVEIGDGAFWGCTGLRDLQLPDGLARIGKRAFEGCSQTLMIEKRLLLPKGLIEIGDHAFEDFKIIGRLGLPKSLKKIGESAFKNCNKLTGDLKLPEGLIKIGNGAFWGCTMLNGGLTLPSNAMFHPSKIEANKTAIATFRNSHKNPTPWDGENVENVEEHKCYDREGKIICFHRSLDSMWVKAPIPRRSVAVNVLQRNPIIDVLKSKDKLMAQTLRDMSFYGKISRITSDYLRISYLNTISAGLWHSLFLTEDLKVLSCGTNNHGELGHGNDNKQNQYEPKLITRLKDIKIAQVAAGEDHSLFLTLGGEVYSCGKNNHGALGHGDDNKQDHGEPKLITSLKDIKIVQVAAGEYHSLFLTLGGKVYSCGKSGKNDHGELGHGNDKQNKYVPKLITRLKDIKIVQVAAGGSHSLFLTQSGEVYSCGQNEYGALGHGDGEQGCPQDQYVPKLITSLKDIKIAQVAAGAYHSLFLTQSGEVYSCGDSSDGLLGHGDYKGQYVPKLITSLKDIKIVQVAAGSSHSLFLTQSGKVYSCGDGFSGQLGHGNHNEQLPVPKLIESLEGRRIVQVAAGYSHSLFLTEGGAVLSCGSGELGQLGGHRPLLDVPKFVDGLEGGDYIQYERVFVHQDSEMVEHDVSTLEAADAFIRDHVIDTSWLSSIGDSAFYNCSNLIGDLKLPKGLTEIGKSAFSECSNLTGELKLPEGLVEIGNRAFKDCRRLNGELTLPEGLTEISDSAFHNCHGLTGELKLPKGLTKIGKSAFSECSNLTGELKLPEGLTEISDSAFNECFNLTGELKLPEGLTEISIGAFHNCHGLTGELKLPKKLKVIGPSAFSECHGLTGELKLPKKLKVIGVMAFQGCTGLTGVIVARRTASLTIYVRAFLYTSVRDIQYVVDQKPYKHPDSFSWSNRASRVLDAA